MIAQAFLVKPLMSLLNETGLVFLALIATVLNYLILVVAAFYPRRWIVFTYSALSGIGGLSFPAIASIKSVNCSEKVAFVTVE